MTFNYVLNLVSVGMIHLAAILLYGCAAVVSLRAMRLSVIHGGREPQFWLYVLSGVVCASFIPMELAWILDPAFDLHSRGDILWSISDIARAVVILLAVSLMTSRFHFRKSDK